MTGQDIRKIIHIDMDAFYASVEQRDDPCLKGRPVAVGYAAKRGVVAAASYEARRFGVRSAMPSTTALRNCPELVFVPPRFEVYRAVSQQIRLIFAEYTHLIEPLALDEAYLDVTENLRRIATASETAKEIRARIREETLLTASAGISYNKFLAKLACDIRKPDGQFVIRPDMGQNFIEGLAVEKFYGVGPVTADRMKRLGIHTGADLRAAPAEVLQRHFGKLGAWYSAIARGEDERPVVPNKARKSLGAEATFPDDLISKSDIEQAIATLADEVWDRCEKNAVIGQTVTVKIKYADFRQETRSRTMASPFESRDQLYHEAKSLINALFPLTLGVRLLGVTLSKFAGEQQSAQLDLELPPSK